MFFRLRQRMCALAMTGPMQQTVLAALDLQRSAIELDHRVRLAGVLAPWRGSLADALDCVLHYLASNALLISEIDLLNNDISRLPDNFAGLCSSLSLLNLLRNNILSVPDYVFLPSLHSLDLSDNKLRSVPLALLASPHIQVLRLQNNRIEHLFSWILDLHHLSVLDIAGNPLVLPSTESIIHMYKQVQGGDSWSNALWLYFSSASQKSSASNSITSPQSNTSRELHFTSPPMKEPASIDSLGSEHMPKASRRRGLVLKLHSDAPSVSNPTTPTKDPHRAPKNASDPEPQRLALTDSRDSETHISPISSGAAHAFLSAAGAGGTAVSPNPPPLPSSSPAAASSTSSSATSLLVPSQHTPRSVNRARIRSNTMREIDKILEKNESVDTENKLGAYFRRLLTLQEKPEENLSMITFLGATSHSKVLPEMISLRPQLLGLVKPREDPVHRVPSASITAQQNLRSASAANDPAPAPAVPAFSLSPSSKAKRVAPHALIKASRKVLFAFSEVHSSVRRFTGFCTDKKTAMKMVSHLYSTKANIDTLVETLEAMEDGPSNLETITLSLMACISSFRLIMSLLHDNISVFAAKTEVCFIRMLYLTLYGALNELQNAFNVISPAQPPTFDQKPLDFKQKLTINTLAVATATESFDQKLYRTIEVATTDAQVVFQDLTRAISKGALAQANTLSSQPSPAVASRVRELTNVCIALMEITNRLKSKVATIDENSSPQDHHALWDDTNLFLKAIIQTFSSVKAVMKDLPALNEIRPSMASLTKTTKDVTILLERLSYNQMAAEAPSLAAMPSVANIFTPMSGFPHSGNLSSNLQLLAGARTGPFNQPMSTMDPAVASAAPLTAPAHSTGQYFAKNGMNPFDGLIMANSKDGAGQAPGS